MMIGGFEGRLASSRHTTKPSVPGNMRSSSTRAGPKASTLQGLRAVGDTLHREAFVDEVVAQHPGHGAVVLDDQHPQAHGIALGSSRRTVVPRPGALSIPTRPPWSVTMRRTIARPRPLPSTWAERPR